jgi:RND family efflux transporter MFP subunit
MIRQKGIFKIVMASSLILYLVTIMGCSTNGVKVENRVKNVKVEKAIMAPIAVNEAYAGRLMPVEEVNVASTIAGRVDRVFFDVGQVINKGQTLFTLKADAQQINQAEAAVNQAQLQYDYARDLYEKTQVLHSSGAIAKQELDKIEKEYQSSLVQLNSARENFHLINNNGTLSGTTGNTVVTAPISGIISACHVSPGEMTSPSAAAFTIIDPQIMYIEIYVSDKKINKLVKGQKLKVIIDAVNDGELEGVVDRTSPNVDPKTKLYTVRIVFSQPTDKMIAGMIAKVLVPIETKNQALQVPNLAVVVEQGAAMVYTVENGTVKKKAVKTGIITEKATEILDNLQAGDDVIMGGQHLLQEGDKIRINEGSQ